MKFISVDDARQRARRVLPAPVFDYVDGGSDDEVTMERNRLGFRSILLRQTVGVDTGVPDLSTTVLGTRVRAPILFAPCGLAGVVHPEGELAVARVALDRGTIGVFSTFSNHPLEAIASVAGPRWFQLYAVGGWAGADVLVERAERAGYGGLVITLDTAIAGKRERDLRHGVRHPVQLDVPTILRFAPHVLLRPRWLARFVRARGLLEVGNAVPVTAAPDGSLSSELLAAPPTWRDVERLRSRWTGSLIVKGVLDPDDARMAADMGADAVIVSNHGGRQLDGVPSSIEALGGVVNAVGDRVEVLLDGGIRRGTDVVKALALGATAVLIGRPYLYGLGVSGQRGVEAVWAVLVEEVERTMRLLGCTSIGELGPGSLWAGPVSPLRSGDGGDR